MRDFVPTLALIAALLLAFASAWRARRRAVRADRRRIVADRLTAQGAVMHVSPPDALGHCKVSIGFNPSGGGAPCTVHQEVTAGVITSLRLAPGSPLEVRHRRDRPTFAFAPLLALAEYTPRPTPGPTSEAAAAWYPVAFEDPDGRLQLLHQGTFPWTGGEVVVDAAMLEIRGLRARAWRAPTVLSRRFALSSVRNVECLGLAVAFELAAGNATAPLRLWFADATAAADFAARLPTMRTADFRPGIDPNREFTRMLLAKRPATPVVLALLALYALGYALATAGGGSALYASPGRLVLAGANYAPLTLGGQPWRLLSAPFLHASILHVLLAALLLWFAGRVAERLYGSARFLLVYLAAALGAGAASLAWQPGVAIGVGATGALCGVAGATLACLVRRRDGVPDGFLGTERLRALGVVALLVLLSLGIPALDPAAHVGGLLLGFALGYALAPPLDAVRMDAVRERHQALGIGVASLAVLAVAVLGGPTTEAVSATIAGGVPGVVPHPTLTQFAGIALGATRAEVEAARGTPDGVKRGTAYYRLAPDGEGARLEVTYREHAAGPRPDDRVAALLYHGDKSHAPPELLYVTGQLHGQLVTDFGPPAWQRHAREGLDYEMYASGLTVVLQHGRVQAYGLQDFYRTPL
jgi:membrane associated rhomboid family serine protease